MASSEAWGQGWSLGENLAAQRAAHKQSMSDFAFQSKVNDLIQQRADLKAKIPALEGTPQYDPAVQSLIGVENGLRELYNPEKNPGMIQKFGWILTDHLGLTHPDQRKKKADAKIAQGQQADLSAARSDVESAPLSPEQTATITANTKAATDLATIQGKMKNLHKLFPDATPEQMQGWQNELAASITGVKPTAEKYFSQLATTEEILPDGTKKLHYWRVPMADEDPEEVDFNGQTMQPKNPPHAGTSKFAQAEAAYRHDHNIPDGEPLTMADIDYINQQNGLSSGVPSSTTTNTLKQDINGAWVPIQETNQRTPGLGTILKDPRGPVQTQASPQSPTGSTAAPTSTEVKKKAQAVAPPSSPRRAGVSVGAPLFQGRTPEYTKAMEDYNTAVKADSMARQALMSHEALQQRNLAISLIKTMAGRVNMQEYQQYTTKMGVENSVDGLILGIENGQLPPGIVKQLADTASANLKASKEALDNLKQMQTQGSETTYKHTATGPNNHKIGTNDDPNSPTAKWFDLKTGKQI